MYLHLTVLKTTARGKPSVCSGSSKYAKKQAESPGCLALRYQGWWVMVTGKLTYFPMQIIESRALILAEVFLLPWESTTSTTRHCWCGTSWRGVAPFRRCRGVSSWWRCFAHFKELLFKLWKSNKNANQVPRCWRGYQLQGGSVCVLFTVQWSVV